MHFSHSANTTKGSQHAQETQESKVIIDMVHIQNCNRNENKTTITKQKCQNLVFLSVQNLNSAAHLQYKQILQLKLSRALFSMFPTSYMGIITSQKKLPVSCPYYIKGNLDTQQRQRDHIEFLSFILLSLGKLS